MVRGPSSSVPVNTKTVLVPKSPIDTKIVSIHKNPIDVGNAHGRGIMRGGVQIHRKSDGPEMRPWMP